MEAGNLDRRKNTADNYGGIGISIRIFWVKLNVTY
jgi:hypothetical protein